MTTTTKAPKSSKASKASKAPAPEAPAPEAPAPEAPAPEAPAPIDWLKSEVALAGWNMASSKASAIEAVRKAGGPEQKRIRSEFMVGYVAFRLAPKGSAITAELLTAAVAALNACNIDAKTVPAGKVRRTQTQERAYAAARTAWKSLLQVADVATAETKGGATRTAPVRPVTPEPAAVVAAKAAVPDATKPAEAYAYLTQQGATMLAYVNKNKRACTSGMRAAVVAFVKAMSEEPQPE